MRFRHLEHQDDVAYSHYGYDSNSNRNSGFYAGVASVTAAYDAQDRMSSYNSKTYTYNANGEIQGSVGSGVTSSYSFDALGSLKGVTIGSTAITYKLDGLGRRSAKYVNGTLQTRFLYEDGLRIGTTLTSTRTLASRFVYGAKGNVPDYMVVGTTTYKIVSDERGSPLLVVNASTGAIAEQITYDEFGNVLSDTAPGFQPFGFAGCLYDQDTKLCQFGARSYDPSTGRWLSKDPLLFGGGDTNLYSYSVNDPINGIDPSGLSSIIFYKFSGEIVVLDKNGDIVGEFPAANNVASNASAGNVPVGTFPYLLSNAHPESGANGPYGSNGIFVFDFPNGSGIGVHSGRVGMCSGANCGYQYPTKGCVRTTDSATSTIQNLIKNDPLTSIMVEQ